MKIVRTRVYTKERILNVAGRVLVDRGFSNLTARDIADAIGISTQPIYLEFVSMDGLKRTLIKSLFHRMRLFYRAGVGASDLVIALGPNFILFVQKYRKIYMASLMEAHSHEEELQQMLQTFLEECLLLTPIVKLSQTNKKVICVTPKIVPAKEL